MVSQKNLTQKKHSEQQLLLKPCKTPEQKPTTEQLNWIFKSSSVNLSSVRARLLFDNSLKLDESDPFFRDDIKFSELPFLIDVFKYWSNLKDYLVFTDGEYLTLERASKKGNYVYKNRVMSRVRDLTNTLNYAGVADYFVRKSGHKFVTNCLFITLQWNTNEHPNRRNSWETSFSKEYNKFITAVRYEHRLGNTWCYKVIESTARGYPHAHLVLLFENPQEVVRHYNPEKKKYTWRLKDKSVINDCWDSYTDVQGVNSLKSLSDYLSKDLVKQFCDYTPPKFDEVKPLIGRNDLNESDKALLNRWKCSLSLGLSWLFRKRSFSISSNLEDITYRIIQKFIGSKIGFHCLSCDYDPFVLSEILENTYEVVFTLLDFENYSWFKSKTPLQQQIADLEHSGLLFYGIVGIQWSSDSDYEHKFTTPITKTLLVKLLDNIKGSTLAFEKLLLNSKYHDPSFDKWIESKHQDYKYVGGFNPSLHY